MEPNDNPTDIFLWANQTDAVKNNLNVEFFVFNKHYTPHSIRFDDELVGQVRALFLYDIINYVNLGAGTGLSVRDFELSDAEENVLLRTELEKVGRAETLLHLIEHERKDIVEFSDEEHDFKSIKGMLARFWYADGNKKPFYIVKLIQSSQYLKGASSWELNGGKFSSFRADVGLKISPENQVLIVDGDIFVFNQSKFERLFNYEFKKQLLADKKVEEIIKEYRLSFPDGMDLQTMVRDYKKVVGKLQKIEVGAIKQEQAVEYADQMQLDLMTDDSGAIIIMDRKDLDMFVNLINEDYVVSQITGKRYEVRSKKLLDDPEGEPPRG
jgi:hypothetical protein